MSIAAPLVSVNLVTYNHEKYVGEAIRSVLRQTMSDLELVVVDDGSTDGTADVIASFRDPRLVSIRQENQGPGGATNRGLASCRGRYIALMTGDDVCYPDRLAVQLGAHARAGGVIFSNVDYIDEDGGPLESCHFPKDFFAIPPLSRAQILERFFRGNFIHTVTTFAEADVLRSSRPTDPLLYQLADYEWLLRLVKHHAFTFLRQPTISYRARSGGVNLSAPEPVRVVRNANEQYLVLRHFFDDLSPELFREAFGARFVNPKSETPVELACEQAFLYTRHPHFPPARLIGVERLHALMNDPEAAAVLREQFGLTIPGFANLLLGIDPLNYLTHNQSQLYVDTGAGFNANQCCRIPSDHRETFELTFDLSSFAPVKGLRWDPVEMHLCRVWIEAISWRDRTGREHALDPAFAGSNGRREPDGSLSFQTIDPMVFLPVVGDVCRLTVRGRWQVADTTTTLFRLSTCLQERDTDALKSLSAVNVLLDERAHTIANLNWHLERFQVLDTSLYLDTGLGFREEEVRRQTFPEQSGPFGVTFTLDGVRLNSLRWDPLELRLCRVLVESVSWTDAQGNTFAVSPELIRANGARQADGTFVFETLDPTFFLPIAGAVAAVTIRGRCEIDDALTSLSRLKGLLIQHEGQTQMQAKSFEDLRGELHRRSQELEHSRQMEASLQEALRHERAELGLREQLIHEQEGRLRQRDEQLQAALVQMEAREQRLQALEAQNQALGHHLHNIVTSRRWRVINSVRSACLYVPRLLSSGQKTE